MMHANAEGATSTVQALHAGASFDLSNQKTTMGHRIDLALCVNDRYSPPLCLAVSWHRKLAFGARLAAAVNPFDALKGEWKGGGTVRRWAARRSRSPAR